MNKFPITGNILSWFGSKPPITKIAIICISLLCIGTVFLVSFLNRQPNDKPLSQLNEPNDKYPALLSSIDDNKEQTGAGTVEADRSIDIEYRISSNETLSEIAFAYSISIEILAYYNNISNPNRVTAGTFIKIPSLENQKQAAMQMARLPRSAPAAASPNNNVPDSGSLSGLSTTKFITLSSQDEYFVVNGTIANVARYANIMEAPIDFSESDQYLTRVRFTKPGFYGLTVSEAGHPDQYYSVFVSPVPTIHTDALSSEFNWYRTQHQTGTTSNCGPASVSMGVGWSTGKDLPVADVRKAVGWQGEGGTSFEELTGVLKSHGIPAVVSPLRNFEHIKNVIDTGGIAIILFFTDGVRSAKGDPGNDLFGKYYSDSVGHYIVIKGYSLNGEYLVIYDPIPSDWSTNSFRYGDNESMIGRNRYYATTELLRCLRRAEMIVVPKTAR
jgi:LysM repeat protein